MSSEVASNRIDELRALAERARRLAGGMTDEQTIANLRSYADQLDGDIERLLAAGTIPAQALAAQDPKPSAVIAAFQVPAALKDEERGSA